MPAAVQSRSRPCGVPAPRVSLRPFRFVCVPSLLSRAESSPAACGIDTGGQGGGRKGGGGKGGRGDCLSEVVTFGSCLSE
eukprot:6269452-Prymnesium_polylepis.1